jgi:hypothetical protein
MADGEISNSQHIRTAAFIVQPNQVHIVEIEQQLNVGTQSFPFLSADRQRES